MKEAYTVYPQKVFTEYFTNPPSRISNLIGGGSLSGYFDVWIRFDCPDVVRLRNSKLFKKDAPDRVSQWWVENHSDEQGTRNYHDLECWTMSEHPDPVTIINGWLLCNAKTNRCWFRVWGRK
jgi:hypothetical protein